MSIRRSTWAWALVVVLGALIGTPFAGASPPGHASLLVNDPHAVGKVGDNLLSLSEAIALANGGLSLAALSPAERRQVQGSPGPDSQDLIRIVLGKGAVITSPPSAPFTSAVGRIAGNTGDTLDGGGATLAGQAPLGDGLLISSSDFTVENLTVKGFNEGVVVDFGGRSLKNITITHMHLMPATLGPLKVGARSSNGRLTGLTISHSVFKGGPAFVGSANVVTLAATSLTTGHTSNTLLTDVRFAHNEVTGGFEGFYIYGAETDGATADHATVRNVKVLDNYFHGSLDASLGLDGATGVVNDASDSGIENVELAHNRIVAKNWGIGIWSGEAFAGGVVQRAFVRKLTIDDNTVKGAKASTGTYCIIMEAGRGDAAGVATESTISNVRITGNKVKHCGAAGIALHGGVPLASSLVGASGIHNVTVSHNRVSSATIGIVLRGTLVGPNSIGLNNAVARVKLLHNTLVKDATGLRLVGAETQQATSIATGNRLTAVRLRNNSIRGSGKPCVTVANSGLGATGNTSTARCP